MSKLKQKLLASNKTINWIPEHIKEGRFGEWLKDVKDWNFSRERYWGTPLPIWECKKCGATEVVGSMAELSEKSDTQHNTFYFLRHGQATSNVRKINASKDRPDFTSRLTPTGIREIKTVARTLTSKKIDLIVSSPLRRAKETAKIVSESTKAPIVYDKELIEINVGVYDGKPWASYLSGFASDLERFAHVPENGESWNSVRARMMNALQKINQKYRHKNILIVSHGDPLFLLRFALEGKSERAIREIPYPDVGHLYDVPVLMLPTNDTGEVDLHRPYIDAPTFNCAQCKKGKMVRVKELADVWFDSGAMPFAQTHWPLDSVQSKSFHKNQLLAPNSQLPTTGYPADYIVEAVDQTRGWFYTLLAVATLLGKEAPYKNVISLGLILDKQGQKMSKSKGNIVDPWAMAEKYGMDAVRWHFYTSAPAGEPMSFDDLDLQKTTRRFHLILWNSLVFYRTYAKNVSGVKYQDSRNVLDQWILEWLKLTHFKVTYHLDKYEIREAALVIEHFVDDLSRWYIRRSRRRFQRPMSKTDFNAASATLGHVLAEVIKLIAPFNPFFAEALHSSFGDHESVHLEDWSPAKQLPISKKGSSIMMSPLLLNMIFIREYASLSLAKRASLGIKVRQPLAELRVKGKEISDKELIEILKDEVNVKKVTFDQKFSSDIEFDTAITQELREEGIVRELVRMVAELRAKANFKASDSIVLMMEVPDTLRAVFEKNEKILKKETGAKLVEYKKTAKVQAEISTKFEDSDVWLAVRKIK